MLYPLKMAPYYSVTPWGGTLIHDLYAKDTPSETTGEAWELSAYVRDGRSMESRVTNGPLAGLTLSEAANRLGRELLGDEIAGMEAFPILNKFLHANKTLSIQVHPNDEYAEKVGAKSKTESWYILYAKPGARLINGLKSGCTVDDMMAAIEQGRDVTEYLNYTEVHVGDVLYIPAGLIHAIGEGILVYEAQQSSDYTYRLYDWGSDRELHIEKGREAIDPSLQGVFPKGVSFSDGGAIRTIYIAAKAFGLEKTELSGSWQVPADRSRFYCYTVIEGQCRIKYPGGEETAAKGETFVIPAYLEGAEIAGEATLLRTCLPDMNKTAELLKAHGLYNRKNDIAGFEG